MGIKSFWIVATLAAIVATATSPMWLNPYYVGILVLTLVFIGLSSAWNLIGGMAGQFSIGHSLFMALGGTTVGALVSLHGWNVWASVLTAVVLSAALAFVISLMTFSRSVPPLSFALVTLALGEVGLLIVTSSEPLGSAAGVVWNQRGEGGLGLEGLNETLWASLALTIVVVAICGWCSRSKFGYYLKAIRDDEAAAASLGINLFWNKTAAMVLSAVLTSVLATLYASHMVFIDPHQFASPVLVITIILYVVVGGMGTVRGPVLGAALLYPLGEVLRGEFADQAGLHMVVFGLAIILIVLFAPSGLSGLIERLEDRIRRRSRRGAGGHDPSSAAVPSANAHPAGSNPVSTSTSSVNHHISEELS